jgi:hypothetical protein
MWKELVSCEDGLTRQVLLSSMDTNSFTSVLGHPTVRFVVGCLPSLLHLHMPPVRAWGRAVSTAVGSNELMYGCVGQLLPPALSHCSHRRRRRHCARGGCPGAQHTFTYRFIHVHMHVLCHALLQTSSQPDFDGVLDGSLDASLVIDALPADPRGECTQQLWGQCGQRRRPARAFFPLIRRSHSICFTSAQGIPKYKIGLRRGKDGRVGKDWLKGGWDYQAWPLCWPPASSSIVGRWG